MQNVSTGLSPFSCPAAIGAVPELSTVEFAIARIVAHDSVLRKKMSANSWNPMPGKPAASA
jgi:hypothetical protein